MKHGYSLVIPPHFDGNNYAYWKVRMKAFPKSIDERVWNSVGTPSNTDGRSPLLLLVNGKLLRKKQLLLIAKL